MPEGRVSPFVRRTPHGASLDDAQKQLNRVWVFTDLVVYGIPVCDAGVYGLSMIDESPLRIRYEAVRSSLDERSRRLSAAAEAKAAGYGGIAAASCATKVARSSIGRGLKVRSRILDGEGSTQGRGQPSVDNEGSNAAGR